MNYSIYRNYRKESSSITKKEQLFKDIVFSSDKEFKNYTKQASSLTSLNFGNRRELFNPIYLSNICTNECAYCGFRKSNKDIVRKTLNPYQAHQEAQFLISRGVKNLLILAGEYPEPYYSNMLLSNVSEITKLDYNWIGVEIAPLETPIYKKLVDLGVGCLVVFQETYDKEEYKKLHGSGTPKSNFNYRYETPFRAIEAGIDEIGLGVLYGVSDWLSDTIAMIDHADEIISFYPDIKLRFSFPNLQPYDNQNDDVFQETITPNILKRIMVAIRILFPKSKLVLTARESLKFRFENMNVVTTVGEDGSTSVGGYTVFPDREENNSQFKLSGRGQIDILKQKMAKNGYILC